jgi:hypothetical protein
VKHGLSHPFTVAAGEYHTHDGNAGKVAAGLKAGGHA